MGAEKWDVSWEIKSGGMYEASPSLDDGTLDFLRKRDSDS